MDSILTTIKKLVGVDASYEHFDSDIIMHINTAFMSLQQLGLGPESGYTISSKEEVWSDFLEGKNNYEGVKTYIYLKTRLVFDPPGNSFLIKAIQDQIQELEWRLRSEAELEKIKEV